MTTGRTGLPLKDENNEQTIAPVWRDTVREIVHALSQDDFEMLRHRVNGVAPVRDAVAKQMRAYVQEYGETVAELDDETWGSSVAQWMGSHWDALVDLWTVESGESDMVLSLKVFEDEDGAGFRFELISITVP